MISLVSKFFISKMESLNRCCITLSNAATVISDCVFIRRTSFVLPEYCHFLIGTIPDQTWTGAIARMNAQGWGRYVSTSRLSTLRTNAQCQRDFSFVILWHNTRSKWGFTHNGQKDLGWSWKTTTHGCLARICASVKINLILALLFPVLPRLPSQPTVYSSSVRLLFLVFYTIH